MLEGVKARVSRISAKTHAGGFLIIGFLVYLLFWRLGSWTAGYGPAESAAVQASASFSQIWQDPLNAPLKLWQLLFQSVGWDGQFWLRSGSALVALGLVTGFYLIARNLFGKPAAYFGSLFLVATPWLVIAGRQASYEILLLVPLALALIATWFLKRNSLMAWFVLCLALGASLYVPGLIWLSLPAIIVTRKHLTEAIKKISLTQRIAGLAIIAALIVPLVLSFSRDLSLLRVWALLPAAFGSVIDCLKSIGWSGLSVVWQTKEHFNLTVGRWPLLDGLQLAIAVFGGFALWDKARKLLIGLLAVITVSIILAGLNRAPAILLMGLPAFGIIFTAGFRYLYIEWRSVFPRNPIPQVYALILISGLIALQLLLTWRFSQAAWPNNPETKSSYMLK